MPTTETLSELTTPPRPLSERGPLRLEEDAVTGERHVSCLELLEVDGWRVKLYAMTLGDEPLPDALLEESRELIARSLPTPAVNRVRSGAGYAIVHAGEHGDYLLLDWWHHQDLLAHHLFGAPKGQRLRYGWPQNVCCCVFEMAVMWFERNAWYRHMLAGDGPNLDGYLAERLEGQI